MQWTKHRNLITTTYRTSIALPEGLNIAPYFSFCTKTKKTVLIASTRAHTASNFVVFARQMTRLLSMVIAWMQFLRHICFYLKCEIITTYKNYDVLNNAFRSQLVQQRKLTSNFVVSYANSIFCCVKCLLWWSWPSSNANAFLIIINILLTFDMLIACFNGLRESERVYVSPVLHCLH